MTLSRYLELKRERDRAVSLDQECRSVADLLTDYFAEGDHLREFQAALEVHGETEFLRIAAREDEIILKVPA